MNNQEQLEEQVNKLSKKVNRSPFWIGAAFSVAFVAGSALGYSAGHARGYNDSLRDYIQGEAQLVDEKLREYRNQFTDFNSDSKTSQESEPAQNPTQPVQQQPVQQAQSQPAHEQTVRPTQSQNSFSAPVAPRYSPEYEAFDRVYGASAWRVNPSDVRDSVDRAFDYMASGGNPIDGIDWERRRELEAPYRELLDKIYEERQAAAKQNKDD